MNRPRSLQEFMHWLEVGRGAGWLRLAATLLAVLVFSLVVAWKQFHGATTEATLVQADMGRQLARGAGFTTLVNYPQTMAFMEKHGQRFDARRPYPELYQAPLYALVVAGGLRLLPAGYRESLFASVPVPPDGFRGDYFLLGLNLVLLWLAAWLAFDLARRLFDGRTAWLAACALLLSVGLWQQTLSVNGTALLMVLALAAFGFWARAEQAMEDDRRRAALGWLAALGAACGLLFLAQYSAGALVLVALGYAVWRGEGVTRWMAAGVVAAGFALVTGPWIARNVALTGSPVALAVQNVALKAGDPTAEPATVRNTLSAVLPSINLNKLGNKMLTSVQEDVKSRLWAGGGMWLTALFAAGWLYTFRSAVANRLRWVFSAALLVLLFAQAGFNSGESDLLAASWLAPLIIVFGAGFFFVLLNGNPRLSAWPRACACALLVLQALPLLHDVLEPRRLHFQYPPYIPGVLVGMRQELERRDTDRRFGVMADVPAGVAWYGRQRVWSQPVKLRDFYAISIEQQLAELLLTPRTLDRPFFSDLAASPVVPDALGSATNRFGEWGRIYTGLFTGALPPEFPLRAPRKLYENFYIMYNPVLPPRPQK